VSLAAHVFVLTAISTVALAQPFDSRLVLSPQKDDRQIVTSRTHVAEAVPVDGSASLQRATTPGVTANDSLQRLAERLRPLQDRLREDDRMRRAEGFVGLGIAAYEALSNRQQLPLSFVGTHALRLGLHRELAGIRERSGYVVEPSIGHRSFVITFRRALE